MLAVNLYSIILVVNLYFEFVFELLVYWCPDVLSALCTGTELCSD